VVILIVQSAERNVFDQRWIEWELFERHGIRSIRKTMQQLANELFIHSDTGVASIK
jgi:glutathione synthase